MTPTSFSSMKQSLSIGIRRIFADTETSLVAGLSVSACILIILILVVTAQRCSRSPSIDASPHSGGAESSQGGDMPQPPADSARVEPKDSTVDSSENAGAEGGVTRSEESGGSQVSSVLNSADTARRRELAENLDAVSRPNQLDFEKDCENPLIVYRSIRDNSEYIASILLQMAKYADSDSTYRLRIAEIEKAHRECIGYEYDDDYCSYRISQSIQNSASLSVLIARCLHDAGGGNVFDSLDSQLQHLPRDHRRANAVCAEVSAIAWRRILWRMADARNKSYRPSKVQHRFRQEGTVMERNTSSFLIHAGLLEEGALALCPGSAGSIDRAKQVREKVVTDAQSKYVQIAAAVASLAETHALLAESL